jgi:hypothetical protein
VVGYLFFSLLFQFLVRAMLCAGGRNCWESASRDNNSYDKIRYDALYCHSHA